MNHFLTSFVSVDLPFSTKVMVVSMSPEGQDGTVENGGINSHAFAKDTVAEHYWHILHPFRC